MKVEGGREGGRRIINEFPFIMRVFWIFLSISI